MWRREYGRTEKEHQHVYKFQRPYDWLSDPIHPAYVPITILVLLLFFVVVLFWFLVFSFSERALFFWRLFCFCRRLLVRWFSFLFILIFLFGFLKEKSRWIINRYSSNTRLRLQHLCVSCWLPKKRSVRFRSRIPIRRISFDSGHSVHAVHLFNPVYLSSLYSFDYILRNKQEDKTKLLGWFNDEPHGFDCCLIFSRQVSHPWTVRQHGKTANQTFRTVYEINMKNSPQKIAKVR